MSAKNALARPYLNTENIVSHPGSFVQDILYGNSGRRYQFAEIRNSSGTVTHRYVYAYETPVGGEAPFQTAPQDCRVHIASG